jgi:Zn-dependent protease with chaperone function
MDLTYDEHIEALTRLSQRRPEQYRRGVIVWTLLGYVVLTGFLVVAVTTLVAMVVTVLVALLSAKAFTVAFLAKGGWVLMVPVFVLVRALLGAIFVRLPPPDGVPVTAADAPALFAMLDELAHSLQVRRPQTVLLTDTYNAGVVSLPRLGVLPWFKNYLLLGMPLMQSVSEAELRAVLAHELGHLSAAHGRLGSWVYRVRESWFRIAQSLHGGVAGAGLLWRFFEWYLPRFSAWTFVLSRANEYQADALAAGATTTEVLARALTRTELGARAYRQHLDQVFEHAKDTPHAPDDLFEQLGHALRADDDARPTWLDEAKAQTTGLQDTHPSLTDRVAAVGEHVRLPAPLEGDAATALLGDRLPVWLAAMSAGWKRHMQPEWAQAHHRFQQDRARLDVLDRARHTPDEHLEWASLVEQHRPDGALAAWQATYEAVPDDARAAFGLGCARLQAEDESGLSLLWDAGEADDNALVPATQLALAFLQRHDRGAETERWHTRIQARMAAWQARDTRRQALADDTPLVVHDLAGPPFEHLKMVLRNSSGIRGAWLWRKEVEGPPVYVLALDVVAVGDLERDDVIELNIQGFLMPDLEADWQIVGTHQVSRRLRKRLTGSEDAEIVV